MLNAVAMLKEVRDAVKNLAEMYCTANANVSVIPAEFKINGMYVNCDFVIVVDEGKPFVQFILYVHVKKNNEFLAYKCFKHDDLWPMSRELFKLPIEEVKSFWSSGLVIEQLNHESIFKIYQKDQTGPVLLLKVDDVL